MYLFIYKGSRSSPNTEDANICNLVLKREDLLSVVKASHSVYLYLTSKDGMKDLFFATIQYFCINVNLASHYYLFCIILFNYIIRCL